MRELSTDEIEAVLTRNGFGILALFDGEYPYPIPMAFGFDSDIPLFVMQFGFVQESRKCKALKTTTNVGFTVYEKPESDELRSVVVDGEVQEISEGRLDAVPSEGVVEARTVFASNAELAPDFFTWRAPIEEVDLHLMKLDIHDWQGSSFQPNRMKV